MRMVAALIIFLVTPQSVLQNSEVMGRVSLFSAPGRVLIKILLKSLQRRCSQQSDLVLVKTSTDNSRWQTVRCSDDRSLYTSLGKPMVI